MQDTGTRLELSCTSYGCAQIGQLVTCAENRKWNVARGCYCLSGGAGRTSSKSLATCGCNGPLASPKLKSAAARDQSQAAPFPDKWRTLSLANQIRFQQRRSWGSNHAQLFRQGRIPWNSRSMLDLASMPP